MPKKRASCSLRPDEVAAIAQMDAQAVRAAMTELIATLDDMAGLLGISRRNIAGYRKDKPIPRHIALAVRHLQRMAAANS